LPGPGLKFNGNAKSIRLLDVKLGFVCLNLSIIFFTSYSPLNEDLVPFLSYFNSTFLGT